MYAYVCWYLNPFSYSNYILLGVKNPKYFYYIVFTYNYIIYYLIKMYITKFNE